MSKILFLANHDIGLYNFRFEIIERFINEGHEVYISTPYGDRIEEFKKIGVYYFETNFERHGTNLFDEIKLIYKYISIIKNVKPDIIFGFTIKPNIYGAIASQILNVPFVANITGLGTAVEYPGIKQKFLIILYKFAFKSIKCVFFQNRDNLNFFLDKKIIDNNKFHLLPGSGVNLNKFSYIEYPSDNVIKFAFISRIMKEKGIDYYLSAAKGLQKKYKNIEFHICGFCEKEYKDKLNNLLDEKLVCYHGVINNVSEFISNMHVVVHPTYYPEGMSNVLLEASAVGRPTITTNRAGCKEIVDDGYNGYLVPEKDMDSLMEAMEKFINLDWESKKNMGINARKKVENVFDRNIVISAYVNELNKINNK